jgi:Ca2+-binding RTX toxin-like protein
MPYKPREVWDTAPLASQLGDAVHGRHALDVMMNTRPELDSSKSPALSATQAGAGAPSGLAGSLVSDLIGAGVSDADNDAVGMAATAVNGGALYFSIDGGTSWTAAPAITAGSALLLAPTARVYFAPAAGSTTTIANALTFRAWDGTSGQNGAVESIGGPVNLIAQDPSIGGRSAAAAGNNVLLFRGSGIDVVDMSGAAPTKVGSAALPESSSVIDMAVAGNHVYVVADDMMGGTTKLITYSLATPTQPAEVSSVSLGNQGARAIKVVDGIAYIASGTSILRYSLTDPAAPVALTSISVGSNTAIGVSNDLIIVGNFDNVLTVIDKASGATVGSLNGPVPVNSVTPQPYDIVIKGQYAFVAIGREGVHIADLSNPASPHWVGSIPALDLQVSGASGAAELVIVSNHLFVASHPTSAVYDITNPLAPVEKQHFTTDLSVSVTHVGGKVLFGADTGIVVVTDGNVNDSVSTAADTVSIDIAPEVDLTPPVVGVTGSGVIVQGNTVTVTSNEAGKAYLVKAGAHAGTPTASELTTLVSEGKAVELAVSNGKAIFPTEALLGQYKAYAVDASNNVSTATSGNTVTVRTVPTMTISSTPVAFTEGDAPKAVAADLMLSDADAIDTGLMLAYVRLVANSPILVGGAPIGSVGASESLVLVADPATMGGVTGTYSADEGVMTLTGTGTLAQWQAALRAVQYSNTSKTPLAGRQVEFTVLDTDGESSTQKTRAVQITAVDDAPVIAGVPAQTQTVAVGTPTTWATVTVADPDTTTLTVTLTATNGAIGGATPNNGVYVLQGTATQINAQLAQLTFTLEQPGTGSVSISVSDGAGRTPVVSTYTFASPAVVPPTTPPTSVDGVPVDVSTGSDGQQQIKIPVVTDTRQEDSSTPNSKLADVTLVKNAAGNPLLNVALPVGTGVTANGPGSPVSGSSVQTALDGRITASQGTVEQKAAAQGFVSSLDANTQVVVQTITVTGQAANGGPLFIGAANQGDGHKTALIIDTRALPDGATINLANVDFAVIVGNARVIGGAGANIAYGDGANQFIVLGEGDDILHGQGGNDTVGSLRGNDQTFGDDGDDVVYGGTGNDTLHGGTGNDRMNGGFGLDTGVQSGVLSDYTVAVDGHTVVLTNKVSGEVDRFLDVEHIVFDSGTSLIVAHEAGDVAGLTAQFADTQLIQLNANRAVAGTAGRDIVTPDLGMALNIDLGGGVDIVRLAGGRSDVHIDVEAGQRAELTRLADGAMLAFNNVELLAFANGNVTVLAHNRPEAVIGRAYELLLDRNVDTDGYTFWLEGIKAGVSLASTLTSIMAAPEYTGAAASNSAFVDLLYANGLGRTADADGKAFWAGALDAGATRAQVLEGFAMTSEAVAVIGSTMDVTIVS